MLLGFLEHVRLQILLRVVYVLDTYLIQYIVRFVRDRKRVRNEITLGYLDLRERDPVSIRARLFYFCKAQILNARLYYSVIYDSKALLCQGNILAGDSP